MESKLSTIWKVWKIIPDLLCQLVEVNAWKRELRSNEYDTPRDILNTFFGMIEPSGLIMNAIDKTLPTALRLLPGELRGRVLGL